MILNCNITSTICNSVRNLFVRHNRKNIGNNFTAMLPCYILPIPQRRTNILSINRFKNINLLQNENETKLRTNVIQLRGKKSKSLVSIEIRFLHFYLSHLNIIIFLFYSPRNMKVTQILMMKLLKYNLDRK